VISRRSLLGLEPPAASPRDEAPAEAVHFRGDHWVRVHRRAMACRFEVTLSSEHAAFVGAAQEALREADRIEERFSVFKETSELCLLNAAAGRGPVEVSEEMFALLETAARLHQATGGAFDPTATPLLRAWGFLRREGRRPDESALQAARDLVGLDLVERDAAARTVHFRRPGVELSFGSFGKGYALDRMKTSLQAAGVQAALLSAGGSSLVAFGSADGFPVDVTSKLAGGRVFRVRLREAAQATSGSGEQFFEADGRRYGHVLDPRTGWPSAGVLSATAVTQTAVEADALSTAFLVAGPAFAEGYAREHPGTWALLVPEEQSDRRLAFGSHPGAVAEKLA
jgi:thiamine biosynthesis lipoprotein